MHQALRGHAGRREARGCPGLRTTSSLQQLPACYGATRPRRPCRKGDRSGDRLQEGRPKTRFLPKLHSQALLEQAEPPAKTLHALFAATYAQGRSCPEVALSRDKWHEQRGGWGRFRGMEQLGREEVPIHTPTGSSVQVPAAWERRGTASSLGTPGRILPRRRQDGDGSEGVPNPAVHPHSLRAAASLTLCLFLTTGSISRQFCPCKI